MRCNYNIKHSLIGAILSLILAINMLLGTTYAWFTESVVSEGNIVKTGNLDVGLLYRELGDDTYKDASREAIFDDDKWEPGYISAKVIRIENRGSLSFDYRLNLVASSPLNTSGRSLAEVIDVYIFDADDAITQEIVNTASPIGTFADFVNKNKTIADGVLLPEGSSGIYPGGSTEFCMVLKMRENLGSEYLNLSIGDGFTVKLFATQFNYENDSFGNEYDQGAEPDEPQSKVVTRQVRLLPDVIADLPEGAIASSPGLVFSTSPYAYTDKTLFAGKHITKIGIPVKSVKALDEEQTFTLSVVKTTQAAYQVVSEHLIKLPLDELGSFTSVNKWIYVDVDIQLADDETLAFGKPSDTVEWAYSSTKMNKYLFRSSNTNWSTANSASILFDVYATETLTFEETQYGLASITESRVFPKVLTDFPESSIAGGNPVEFTNPPYSYLNQTLFSGSRITKIGVPVKSVAAINDNQFITISVIKVGSEAYQVVSEHALKVPVTELANGTTLNKWLYWDVDISLAEDETLAFGGKNDTVIWAWKSGFADTIYSFRDSKGGTTKGIFFDIYTEKVLTYDEYLDEQEKEQERLEAEQAQAARDAALKEILSGKGISILGDSISTYQGWSNNTSYNSTIGNNAIWYTGSNYGFTTVSETWWMQSISRSGLELVVNNSWSGDCVVNHGIERSLQLHNNDAREPDIIAVYLGINDFRTKVTAETFRSKYEEMISGMLAKYDAADVYLFTLVYTTNVNSGVNPADVVAFNEVIKDVAQKYGCTLVDLYNESGINKDNLATYMGDGKLHPNYAGMDRITQCFIDALAEKYLQEKSN